MPITIQRALKLSATRNYGFVNVYVDQDVRLFLNYTLIDPNDNSIPSFSNKLAWNKIIDFFDSNIKLFSNGVLNNKNQDKDNAINNILKLKEVNETHLGYTKLGVFPQGKGPVHKQLEDVLEKIVNNYLTSSINKPMDLMIFVPGLGADRFSDLLTNIIFKELYDYSYTTLKKLGKLRLGDKKEYHYWSIKQHAWISEKLPELLIAGKPMLLVPTKIVSKNYQYSTEKFLHEIILKIIQRNNPKPDGKLRPIKEIEKEEVANTKDHSHKLYALNKVIEQEKEIRALQSNKKCFEENYIDQYHKRHNDYRGTGGIEILKDDNDID